MTSLLFSVILQKYSHMETKIGKLLFFLIALLLCPVMAHADDDNDDEADADSTAAGSTFVLSRIEVPNAFSPNGDGINDVFRVKDTTQNIIDFRAIIFNRWGQKIYEWDTLDGGWDGTHNGRPVKDGVYFVLVKAKGGDGRDHTIRRDVNLIRKFNEVTGANE